MFDQKAQAEAMILDDLGQRNTVTTDMHGVDRDHHKYILEVRPASMAEHPKCEYCARVALPAGWVLLALSPGA